MSPQRSNRDTLIEGTLRCLERLPVERITSRVIADESGANLASIAYHFGSKDALISEAAVAGLDRWLAAISVQLNAADKRDGMSQLSPAERFVVAAEIVAAGRIQHESLARAYIATLAKAQHDERVRARLAAGFRDARPALAAVLDLPKDTAGEDAAGLALALFHGLLYQTLLDPELAVDGARFARAAATLRDILPTDPTD